MDDVPTPWPAFSFVTQSKTEGREKKIKLLRDAVFPALKEGIDLFLAESDALSIAAIVKQTGNTEEEARRWLSQCRYAASVRMPVDRAVTETSVKILKTIGLVAEDFPVDALWHTDENVSNSIITIATE